MEETDSFYVADLDEVFHRYNEWKQNFPRISPLYAVKNNPDRKILTLLSYLGVGFECSSLNEIEDLVKYNIPTDKMLFGNPSKPISNIKYCETIGVNKLVFDNHIELLKIKENHPNAECLLRIQVKSLSCKFGANQVSALKLIKSAIEMKINLSGISFYVGFRQKSAVNFIDSIKNARFLFDYAKENHNYLMNCLDIGGGFPGSWQTRDLFCSIARDVNAALDEYFPSDYFAELNKTAKKFDIISELGTFFTCSAFTLCVSIISKKEIDSIDLIYNETDANNGKNKLFLTGKNNSVLTDVQKNDYKVNQAKSIIYYINDSIYGSFKWHTLSESLPVFVNQREENVEYIRSCIGGATCDSGDFILKNCLMPELEIGEFLIFRNMGSYTKACAIAFCGIQLPETIYVSSKMWETIKEAFEHNEPHHGQHKMTFKQFNGHKLAPKNILKSLTF